MAMKRKEPGFEYTGMKFEEMEEMVKKFPAPKTGDNPSEWPISTKETFALTPPRCIAIDIKRFRQTGMKALNVVNFDEVMEIVVSGETCSYTLQGVVLHHGDTTSGGHYTALVRVDGQDDKEENVWANMDDHRIGPIPRDNVFKSKGKVRANRCRLITLFRIQPP